jgi:hypothetical protein
MLQTTDERDAGLFRIEQSIFDYREEGHPNEPFTGLFLATFKERKLA